MYKSIYMIGIVLKFSEFKIELLCTYQGSSEINGVFGYDCKRCHFKVFFIKKFCFTEVVKI